MRKTYTPAASKNPLKASRNWEENIRSVVIEPCDEAEDPLCYKAIFYLTFEAARNTQKKTFEIGASFLAQLAVNSQKLQILIRCSHSRSRFSGVFW